MDEAGLWQRPLEQRQHQALFRRLLDDEARTAAPPEVVAMTANERDGDVVGVGGFPLVVDACARLMIPQVVGLVEIGDVRMPRQSLGRDGRAGAGRADDEHEVLAQVSVRRCVAAVQLPGS